MIDQAKLEIDQLWQRYSKEDLWNRVSEWWESANRARVVMLLAMHHTEELSLPDIVEQTGEPEASVLAVLADLQKQGVVECRVGEPPRYRIGDETKFLKFMQECCQRTTVAAGFLSTLAGWAGGSD